MARDCLVHFALVAVMRSKKVGTDKCEEEIAGRQLSCNLLINLAASKDFTVVPFSDLALTLQHGKVSMKAVKSTAILMAIGNECTHCFVPKGSGRLAHITTLFLSVPASPSGLCKVDRDHPCGSRLHERRLKSLLAIGMCGPPFLCGLLGGFSRFAINLLHLYHFWLLHSARWPFDAAPTAEAPRCYSHSIVPGGLDVMSYVTRLIPRTSLMMRLATRPRNACSNG